jgi:dihydroxy-acid dehydratase
MAPQTQSTPRKTLRSARWLEASDMRGFAHRQRLQQIGWRREDFIGKPVIAIINTWSDISTCHSHLRERAQVISQAIIAAGGFPIELPALSLSEIFVKPTSMLYRNLLALETEELLRSHPVDGAVLLGGCDKTTPGLVMGGLSVNLPIIFCPAGPMLNDSYRGEKVGAGTHTRKYWDEYQAGRIDVHELQNLEQRMTRSIGTCNTMGTASTMTTLVEALGLALPGSTAIPAADAAHIRMCRDVGSYIVQAVCNDLRPSKIATPQSFKNAGHTLMAIGGSTNAAIHLLALARRANVTYSLADLDSAGRQTPLLVDLFPAGEHLMEDFFYAGGLPALFTQIAGTLDLDCLTVSGQPWSQHLKPATHHPVIRTPDNPVSQQASLAVLYGNLAPDGAVIKPSAATPELLYHRGKAWVFDSYQLLKETLDNPDNDIDENSVLVLRNAGPVGAPGMPEWGNLPIPKHLLAKGVRDLVRLSDARMSGTHYGTCVLHIAPESAVGGPLAWVHTGDEILLDVANRTLQLLVSDEELASRQAQWQPAKSRYSRGYTALYQQHVQQANEGCDFDFLAAPGITPEPDIY